MITKTIQYWEITTLVRERIAITPVIAFIEKHFGSDWNYNVFKAGKDEVLQIYDSETCFTCIGGSSADKEEWRSNFNALPLHNGIHRGYWNGSNDVLGNASYIERPEMIFLGHSRGGAIASVLVGRCINSRGVGFGTPKAYRKRNERLDFVNVRNPLDPVVHVVPFFATVGEVRKVKFAKHPHTQYGHHINKEELI